MSSKTLYVNGERLSIPSNLYWQIRDIARRNNVTMASVIAYLMNKNVYTTKIPGKHHRYKQTRQRRWLE